MRLVLIILFLCFYSLSPASAQTRNWGGTVHDARTGEALPAVSVCLLRADSSIVQFAQTDAEGRWRLQAADGAGAFLSFSFIGFAKQVIPLAECTESMDVRLRETTIQIREVTVRGNRIWQRGDTLTYRVAGFSQAQDRTIEDVLKKIPGIEVGGSGQIKFQGKPINKLYVEGMDLLGGKYALATRNMPHKMVKNVQVLQSHQPVAALRGKSFSDQAALNLVLEDNARHRLIGIVDLGVGIDWDGEAVWENRLMGMIFGRRMQNLTMYKNNNTGSDLASEINPLAANTGIINLSNGERNFFGASPTTVRGLGRSRYLDNNAHLLAVNHLYKPMPTRDLRLQLTALHDSQDASSGEETTYYYPSQTITVSEAEDYHAQLNRLDAELGYERNDSNVFIKNNLSGALSLQKTRLNLLTNGDILQQRIRPKRQHIANSFSLIRNYGGSTFSLQTAAAYSELPQRLTATPGPYADLLNGGQAYELLTQEAKLNSFRAYASTYFQHRVAGIYLKYRAGASYGNRLLTSGILTDETPLTAPEYANHLRLQTVEAYVEPSLNLKREFWDVQFRLPLTWEMSLLDGRLPQATHQRMHKFMPTPSLNVKYDLTAFWEATLASSVGFRQPDIHSLYGGYLFSSYRSATAYVPQLTYDKHWYSRLALRFNNPLRGFFFNVLGYYTMARNEWLYQYENQESYLNVARALRRPHTNHTVGVSTRLSQAFDWKRLYIALSASYTQQNGSMMWKTR